MWLYVLLDGFSYKKEYDEDNEENRQEFAEIVLAHHRTNETLEFIKASIQSSVNEPPLPNAD